MDKIKIDVRRRLNTLELIGLVVDVLEHTDPTLIGLSGDVIDETKNTFLLEIGGVRKKVSKKGARFRFHIPDGDEMKTVLMDGDLIAFRPEDRTKKCQRKPLKRDS